MLYGKFKIVYFNGKHPLNLSFVKFHSKYFGLLWVKHRLMIFGNNLFSAQK